MRFLLGIVGVAPIVSIYNGPTCRSSGDDTFMSIGVDWYRVLTYAAINGSITTPADIHALLSANLNINGGDVPTVAMGANLVAAFDGVQTRATLGSDCFRCAFDFVIAAQEALDDSDAHLCEVEFDTDYSYSDSSVMQSGCLLVLYEAIEAFNACSENDLNFVTREASTRCTATEFTDFAIAYNPLSAIAECVFDDSSFTTVEAIGTCVGGSTFLAARLAIGCSVCVDDLMLQIAAFAEECEGQDVYSFWHCPSENLEAAIEAFGVCSGGFRFEPVEEDHCGYDQLRVIDAIQPYDLIMHCIFNLDVGNPSTCLETYSSLVGALSLTDGSLDCIVYFENFYAQFDEYKEDYDCEDHIFGSACTSELRKVDGLLYTLEVSSGTVISTRARQCLESEWLAISDSQTSYVPLLRCALASSSIGETLDCVETDELLAPVWENVSCASCWKQFAIEAFVVRANDASLLTDIVCLDPYSLDCLELMSDPLLNFEVCSGFAPRLISNGECTSQVEASLLANGVDFDGLASIIRNSKMAAEAVYTFTQIANQMDSYSCKYCYIELIHNVYETENLAACVADLSSWACYMSMGPHLNNFWKCARGWTSDAVATTRSEVGQTT